METSVRYLILLDLIPVYPRKIDVRSLRDRLIERDPGFDVSTRTIERDLVQLSRHFCLSWDDNKPRGWWKSVETPTDPRLPRMTPEIARAFREVARVAEKTLSRSTAQILAPYFEQAHACTAAPKVYDFQAEYRRSSRSFSAPDSPNCSAAEPLDAPLLVANG
jgi:hypothetical protein